MAVVDGQIEGFVMMVDFYVFAFEGFVLQSEYSLPYC
jgi:hypothetical protein